MRLRGLDTVNLMNRTMTTRQCNETQCRTVELFIQFSPLALNICVLLPIDINIIA